MAFIPALVRTFVEVFKANPRRVATIVAAAIGYLTIFLEAVNLIVPKAIEILRQVLAGLS